jgi:hypothetical protein
MSMTNQFWFKPKTFGYGTVPTTWQGWILTLGFGAFVAAMVVATELKALSPYWCVVAVLAVTVGFVALTKAKTDGEWRWRWGADAKEKD